MLNQIDFTMDNSQDPFYESPQIETLEIEIESAILVKSDPTITNPDMEWDD